MTELTAVMREAEWAGSIEVLVLDDRQKIVGSYMSSNSSWGRKDADAIADRLGGKITRYVDQTSMGRPWIPMPVQGQFGCPVCGCIAWEQRLHCMTCPPREEFKRA